MKMYFFYGVMNSSKTAMALMKDFSFAEHGKKVVLLKPSLDKRDGEVILKSRIGLLKKAVVVNTFKTIKETVKDVESYDVIIVDEAQFLTVNQVNELRTLADNSPMVMCYGLKTDYMGNLFQGSKRLIEVSDCIRELPAPCLCGKKAIMNAKYIGNKIIYRGDQIDLGGNEKYIGLCHSCWKSGTIKKDLEEIKASVFVNFETVN